MRKSQNDSGYIPYGAEFNSRLFFTAEEDKEKFVQTVSPYIPESLSGRLANPLEPLLENKMVERIPRSIRATKVMSIRVVVSLPI